MKVTLIKSHIRQFKGVDYFEGDFSESTIITGTNATCKTTVGANAITWCFFGKDIFNRSDYQIMPVDKAGEMIPNMEPSVELICDIDGSKKKFKRVMTQKWVKKRGEMESKFDGSCTTSYFVDDVPLKKKEYTDAVNAIISEDLFRIITLPTHFPSLDWKAKRDIVISIIGDVDMDSIKSQEQFKDLIEAMAGKSAADFRKVIAFQKKELKSAIDKIPASIEAAKEFIPDEEPNYSSISDTITEKKDEIKQIDAKIADKTSVLDDFQKELDAKSKQLAAIEEEKQAFISDFLAEKQSEIEKINDDKLKVQQYISGRESDIRDAEAAISKVFAGEKALNERLKLLTNDRRNNEAEYKALSVQEFSAPEDGKCLSCGQDIVKTQEEVSELEAKFNNNKAEQLKAILDKNAPAKAECEKIENVSIPENDKESEILKKRIVQLESELKGLKETSNTFISKIAAVNISAAKEAALKDEKYLAIIAKADAIKNSSTEAPKVDVSEFDKQKDEIQAEIELLQKQLNSKDSIDKAKANVARYQQEGKSLAVKLAEIEGMEYSSELLERAIAEDVESRINSRLTGGVTFKMFHKQNNEGIKPICEILINGVPYNSANTAAQISAGVTIINLLSEHYDAFAPIIIDNRESIVSIPETKSQTISLVVAENVKQLTLSHGSNND